MTGYDHTDQWLHKIRGPGSLRHLRANTSQEGLSYSGGGCSFPTASAYTATTMIRARYRYHATLESQPLLHVAVPSLIGLLFDLEWHLILSAGIDDPEQGMSIALRDAVYIRV